jgi:hypothetical protein
MAQACPVSFKSINITVSRLSSFIVSLLVIYYLYSSNVFVLYFLLIDFVTRLFYDKKFSLVDTLSRILKKTFKLEDVFGDSGAKRLAGIFGLLFVVLLIISYYMGLKVAPFVIGGVFVLCSLMDALVNYCVGCKIYFIIKKIYPNFMNP